MKVRGVLTGQVAVDEIEDGAELLCAKHRVVAHDSVGSEALRYCNRCGRNDKGRRLGQPNGGWA